jgi:hypothetical protein
MVAKTINHFRESMNLQLTTMKKLTYHTLAGISICLLMTGCIKDYNNPAEGVLNQNAELYVLRQAFKGSSMTLSESNIGGARFTSGVVISDKDAGNNEPGTFVIQNTTVTANQAGDLTTGMVVEMGGTANLPALGDSIVLEVIGATLQRKAGKLVLSGITPDKIKVAASNRPVAPRPVTLAMLNANFFNYESTLISVHADVVGQGTGVVYSGEKQLNDNTGTVVLLTRDAAAFAATAVPANAQFTGIAFYSNSSGNDTTGAKKTISLRNSSDVQFISGTLYPGFPESFETPDVSAKSSYNITATANNIDLSTGNWKLQQAILANTLLSDKINFPGKQNVRMQQNLTTSALVQMNFDVTQGASKVTLFYGRYGTDPMSTFRLEYSTNAGTSWTIVNPTISSMPEKGSTQATFMVNVTGNVRFRINKLGLGASSPTIQNGRLSIEDIAIYKR